MKCGRSFKRPSTRNTVSTFAKRLTPSPRPREKQNLDGALLAYLTMTMQCVDCHKHVRDVRMAALDDHGLPPSFTRLAPSPAAGE
ncbi:MAG: hypothetical protein QM775_31325 [Pirellulales bacterium]